jgi:hypothetical protein
LNIGDDYILNTMVGNLGNPIEVDQFGMPWSHTGPEVSETVDCFDDEVSFDATKTLRIIMNKTSYETLTFAKAVPFGQTSTKSWMLDVSMYCPISS